MVSSDTGSPLANATVETGGKRATTDANGVFTLSDLAVTTRAVLAVRADGYGKGFGVAEVLANTTTPVSVRLALASPPQTFAANAAAMLTAPGSAAQVQLPADALVVASTGAAATGSLTARITPINPARDPGSMPGDYTSSTGGAIESFGALNVELTDASGARLNLKPGSTATVRIPLATRSADTPATIPLYFFNESTGLWVQEGTATLRGTAPDQYYEGTVTHFTVWNADRPAETIFVRGCLRNADGSSAVGQQVQTEGIDYSGIGTDLTDAQGGFAVPMRRGGLAALFSEAGLGSNSVTVGPSETDIVLTTCLQILASPIAPQIVKPPVNETASAGGFAFFEVSARGSQPLRYQWQFNGTNIPDATLAYLVLPGLTAGQAGTYTVVVSNSAGSAAANATLTVQATVPQAPVIFGQPVAQSVVAGASATFSVGAEGADGYQWLRNGVAIAGATGPTYTLTAAALTDNGAAFSAVVSNAAGSATSAAAVLTVTAAATPPSIATPPGNVTAAVGERATFSVVATGTGPLSYQWRRNGTAIAAATEASYTTPTLTLADNGAAYSVVVSNAQGSLTSAPASLTVTDDLTAERVAAVRLMYLSSELFSLGFAPFEAVNDTNLIQTSAQTCPGGGSVGLSLNGATPAAGTALPTSAASFVGTFRACSTVDGDVLNGTSSVVYNGVSLEPTNGSGTATLTNMRRTVNSAGQPTPASDVTGNGSVGVVAIGSVAGSEETVQITITPGNGASLRNELSGVVAAFQSGSAGFRVVTNKTSGQPSQIRQQFNALTFSVAGVAYVCDGSLEFGLSGSGFQGPGEVILRSGGQEVARLVATRDGLQIVVNGQVVPF